MEVDVLAECADATGRRLVPLEVKKIATATQRMGAPMRQLRDDLGTLVAPGYVV